MVIEPIVAFPVIMFPVHPAIFGVFLGAAAAYVAYGVVKVVISLWTGA